FLVLVLRPARRAARRGTSAGRSRKQVVRTLTAAPVRMDTRATRLTSASVKRRESFVMVCARTLCLARRVMMVMIARLVRSGRMLAGLFVAVALRSRLFVPIRARFLAASLFFP
ncbi:MAG: hypothetical protein ACTSUU_04390, partial [Candidatus Thorarchaeota archaeon]